MPAFEPRLTALFQQILTLREDALLRQGGLQAGAFDGACQEALDLIGEARSRLINHTFGWCQACQGRIDLRRLASVPTTLYCEPCQACHEQQQPLAVRRLTLQLKKGISQ